MGDDSDYDDWKQREGIRREENDPHAGLMNLEAEALLLGTILIDNASLDHVSELLTAEDFYLPLHQRLFAQTLRFYEQGKTVTPVTLKPIFERDPAINDLGGIAYLAKLTADGSGVFAFRELATQIAEFSQLRQIVTATRMMVEDYRDGGNLDESVLILDEAMAQGSGLIKKTPVDSAADMVGRVIDRSDRITRETLEEHVGVKCGTVSDLNTLLGPIEDGTYVVLGGRPSMGKTTMGSSAAWGFASQGFPTLYLAAEGTPETLAMRFVADLSLDTDIPIEHDAIRKDRLTPIERAHYQTLRERAESLPIDYQVPGRCDVRRLRTYVSRAAAKWKETGRRLRVVVVDYMQLFKASKNGREIDDDRRAVNEISSTLLGIAKDFGVTVIALSQLSRALEQREDKRPRLSDLRESGRIEEDADAVLFVYREEYYLERNEPERSRKDYQDAHNEWQADLARCRNRVDLILAKNRHGEVKTRTCKFYGKYTAIRGGDFEKPAVSGELGF